MPTHTIANGDVVELSNPVDERERAARYVVEELRGDRVLIRLICDLPIPPTEVVALNEARPASRPPTARK